jgi:hypothetical protein
MPRAGASIHGSGRFPALVAVAAATILSLAPLQRVQGTPVTRTAPETLQETGLYADFAVLQVSPEHLAFSPQYPLWTDGATKRRWISLPPGAAIDGSDPDAWVFPIGTRLWKEFSFNGQRVETRYIARQADGQWQYAAYAWSADGKVARLVSEQGKRGTYALNAKRSHSIPAVSDCKACHQGGPSEVLGFSALQLSPDRDPNAPHAEMPGSDSVDLKILVEKGLIFGLPTQLLERPPRVAGTPTERAALGYLHGNCGHCHNAQGSLQNLSMYLSHTTGDAVAPAIASTVNQPIRNMAPGQSPEAVLRVEPQHPERSGLMQRVGSRYSALQMPPLGTELVDKEAVELLERWINEVSASPKEARLKGRENR